MGAIATFDYNAWVALYPVFAGVPQPQAQGYFSQATIYWRNDGSSPVNDPGLQLSLLNMLTAHISWLSSPRDPVTGNPSGSGLPPPGLVGRIASATEGSVSVTADYGKDVGPDEAWFIQTTWGAMYWQAIAAFRTFRYRPNPTAVVNGAYPAFPFGWNN